MAAASWVWLKELRFLQLTLYFLFFLFALPYFGWDWIFKLFSSIFLLNALLVSLSASGTTVRLKWLLWLILGVSMIFTMLYLVPLVPDKRSIFLQLGIVSETFLMLLCLIMILIFIFQSRKVTLDTIFAAVVAYLFCAFVFAQAYRLLIFYDPQSFNLNYPLSPNALHIILSRMMYYSLIVITSVGLVDIIPQTPMAQTLSTLEAVIGQFFVAILVAWLVGRFRSESEGD
jgi:hypothetical protein